MVLEKRLEKKNFRNSIFAIAIPIMLSNLVTQIEMLVDRMFLSNLSISCMSAVGNADSPIWTCISVGICLSLGSVILISQALGAKENTEAKSYMASLFKYSNIFAVILFLVWMFLPKQIFELMGVDSSVIGMSVDYARFFSPFLLITGISASLTALLQVSQQTTVMVVYGVVRSFSNIFLDYALIFGNFGLPKMGVAGAALGTAIAEYIGLFVVLYYVLRNKELWLKPKLKEIFHAKPRPYIDSIKKGIPSAGEEFAWNLGNIFVIVMLNKISPDAAGIFTIVFSVELLPICVYSALSNAVLTLSGQETGKGHPEKIKTLVGIGTFWSSMICLTMLILFILIPKEIIGLFTSDEVVITSSVLYLLIVGFDLFPKSFNITIGAGIRGYGDTRWMLFTQCFGTVFIIVGSWLLVTVFNLGISSLFILIVIDESVRSLINFLKLQEISQVVN